MKFEVDRMVEAGTAVGGHIIDETFGFPATFAVAGIRIRLGFETAWISRDEAHEIAAALLEASIDG